MSSHTSLSLKNLSGKYRPAKDSGDVSPVLALQGFGRLMRFAMSRAPVYVTITQISDNEVQIAQNTTANIPGVTEYWMHDWQWREHDDKLFKRIKCRSRWIKPRDVDDEWLVEGLDPDEEVVEAVYALPNEAWVARQIWRIEGGRFLRRAVTKKGEEEVKITLTYDAE